MNSYINRPIVVVNSVVARNHETQKASFCYIHTHTHTLFSTLYLSLGFEEWRKFLLTSWLSMQMGLLTWMSMWSRMRTRSSFFVDSTVPVGGRGGILVAIIYIQHYNYYAPPEMYNIIIIIHLQNGNFLICTTWYTGPERRRHRYVQSYNIFSSYNYRERGLPRLFLIL